ncbi:MAG: pitrilysin family protein [Phycisphaerales bacterium]
MKITHIVLTAAAAATLLSGVATAQDLPKRPEEITFKPLDFNPPKAKDYRRTLSDGTVVYMAPSKEFPLVNVSFSFKGGAWMDPKEIPGLTGAMAALMRSGGTTSVPPAELDEKLDFLATTVGVGAGGGGGRRGGGGSRGGVSASMNTLTANLDQSLALFFDILRNPAFDQARLEVMRGQAVEGMKQRNDDAGAILGREWSYLMFGEDAADSAQPTKEGWDSITREKLQQQHARLIHPGNLIIAVTGDFDPDEMMKKLEKGMEGWTKGEKVPNPPAPTATIKPGVYHVEKDIPQGKVRVGRRSIMRDDPDYFSAAVMNEILGGGGFTSRLMKNIRSNEGLAYSVGSSFGAGTYYPGVFLGSFESKNPTVALSIKLMRDEFSRMRDEPVSAEELEVAKKSFIEAFPQQFSSKDAVLGLFVDDEWTGRDPSYWQNYRANIQKVSADDVQRVAKKFLNFDDMVVLVVGKWSDIAKGDPTGRATMKEFFNDQRTDLPLRDPLTMKPMDAQPPADSAPSSGSGASTGSGRPSQGRGAK